jgi:hypothetical protein
MQKLLPQSYPQWMERQGVAILPIFPPTRFIKYLVTLASNPKQRQQKISLLGHMLTHILQEASKIGKL